MALFRVHDVVALVTYTFEVLIPWEAFPPFHLLRLEDLRFRVEVVNPATEDHQSGPVSTTSPPRRYGEADRFSLMHLGQPRQYELTPCWIPVAQDDDGFFKPSQRLDIWEVLFETYHFACTHCRPTGQFFSVFVQPYYMRQLDETRFLCGPPARVLRRGQVYPSEFAIGPAFDVRQLPDGDLLIKQGPEEEERDSTGACGSCPYVFLAIYHLDGTTNALTRVFGEGRIQELGGDKIMRFEVSTDWMRIDVYVSQSEENEELTSYCFSPNPARYSNCTPPVAKSGTSTERLDPGEEESR